MSVKKQNLSEIEVYAEAIETNGLELNDFESLVEDFMEKCGCSEEEAEIMASNVLKEDSL